MVRQMKGKKKKCFIHILIILLVFNILTPAIAGANSESLVNNAVDIQQIKLDPSYQHDPFDGWGTALVWFANVTGGWPDEIREPLADALFGEDGLNFNIGRYNIGGGDSPETEPYMRLGGAVPGYWNRPAEFGPPEDAGDDWTEQENWWDPNNPDHWNWEADANQRWWVEAAHDRGANIFEAFSNSPPYFMTQSGYVSGNFNSWDDNIKHDQFDNFAKYLTGVVEHLQESMDIEFQTLSPINEPNNGYWGALGRQEGANWSPQSQQNAINAVKAQLDAKGLDTVVSAMDETNPNRFRYNWERYSQTTKDNIGQLNVHTYWPAQRGSIRDIAKGVETRLWMSEVDLGPGGIPQNHEDIRPALALSERIQTDIQELEPKAWVLWQAIEDEVNMNADNENMNWGLIHVDFDPEDFDTLEWHKNKKYYAMGNYSKFIRPGYQFINSDNRDTLAAINTDSETLVLVYTNHSNEEKALEFDLRGFGNIDENASAVPHVTSSEKNLVELDTIDIRDNILATVVEPQSVTTFVVSGVSEVNEEEAFLVEGLDYKFIAKHSGRAMDISTANGTSIVQRTNVNEVESQHWHVEKLTDGYSNTEYYKIIHRETGKVLGANGRNLMLQDRDDSLAGQSWILSTFGNGEYTLLNGQQRELVDVGGQSTANNASVGLWTPNAGNNQVWRLVVAGITEVEQVNVITLPGVEPVLPSEVTVTFGDGERKTKEVDWDSIDPTQYAEENIFAVEGTIAGTDTKVTANVTVSYISSVDDLKLKTVIGQAPTLPGQVEATLNIGTKAMFPVEWEPVDSELYSEYGKFTVKGTVEGTDIQPLAQVQVENPGVENIALNPRGSGQGFPKPSASFTGQWDSVNHINDGVISSDRWTNWDPNNWRESDWVSLDFGKTETISQVDFYFYDDQGGTRPPETLYLEYWNDGEWVEIPDTYLEIPVDVRTTEASVSFEELETSQIRVQMTAMANTCIAIVELEVQGLSETVPAIGSDATLEGLVINGKEFEGFDGNNTHHVVHLWAGTFEIPTIKVETNHLFASYDIALPDSIDEEAVIVVTAEDGVTEMVYTLEFQWVPRKDWSNMPFPHPVFPGKFSN